MEQPSKGRTSTTMKAHYLCLPIRVRSNTFPRISNHKKVLSPVSLLDRFREAVFRLIMLSALSKPTDHERHHRSYQGSPQQPHYQPYHCSPHQPHHSEAVADCIEFIKKKSATVDQASRDSSTANSPTNDHVVTPFPVM